MFPFIESCRAKTVDGNPKHHRLVCVRSGSDRQMAWLPLHDEVMSGQDQEARVDLPISIWSPVAHRA
jgi:hypothetical protein